jgi:hypothetical protein
MLFKRTWLSRCVILNCDVDAVLFTWNPLSNCNYPILFIYVSRHLKQSFRFVCSFTEVKGETVTLITRCKAFSFQFDISMWQLCTSLLSVHAKSHSYYRGCLSELRRFSLPRCKCWKSHLIMPRHTNPHVSRLILHNYLSMALQPLWTLAAFSVC